MVTTIIGDSFFVWFDFFALSIPLNTPIEYMGGLQYRMVKRFDKVEQLQVMIPEIRQHHHNAHMLSTSHITSHIGSMR